MKIERTIEPAVEPVTLSEAKAHLRLDGAAEDAFVAALIVATRDACEAFLDRVLVEQTWKLTLNSWPRVSQGPWWDGVRQGAIADVVGIARHIDLPKGLIAVTKVETFDKADVGAIFDPVNYFVSSGKHGRLVLKSGASWPTAAREADGVEITFTAGFGPAPSDVPQSIRTGLLLLIADLYENRGDDPADRARASGVTALWRPHARVEL